MNELLFLAEAHDEGERLDTFLSRHMEGMSRNSVQRLIDEGAIAVNGRGVNKNYRLKPSDAVSVAIPEPVEPGVAAENIPLEILYEDTELIVINKPQGMVVHPAPGHYSGTVVNALLYHCGESLSGINGILRPGIVHRIDKDTSGVIVAAKTNTAHNALAAQLQDHSMNRIYIAAACGRLKQDIIVIDRPIGRSPADRKKMAVTAKNSRNAYTTVSVLERYKKYTLVEAKLQTGRTHQIRTHMAHIGHPLLGDTTYGSARQPYGLQGQMLHARLLGFIHPSSGKYMEFQTEPPEYFQRVVRILRDGGC